MNPDFIEVYDNMLSHSECEEIIDYIDSSEKVRGTFSGEYHPKIKDDWEAPIHPLDEPTPINRSIERVLRKAVAEYWLKHPQIRKINSWGPDLHYNLQMYNPKQGYYASHCENGGQNAGIHRILVWMIYLNTVTVGGGTYFENYDRTTDAVEGRVVLWPPYWTHFHNGVVSNTQKKYIATGWFESQ